MKDKVDAECKRLTAPWIRASNFDVEQDCKYLFEYLFGLFFKEVLIGF